MTEISEIWIKPQQSARDANSVFARYNGFLILFDTHHPQPAANKWVKVMIVGILWYKKNDVNDMTQKPKALFVRAVTADDLLVEHKGFSAWGPHRMITAYTAHPELVNNFPALTPARLLPYLVVADRTTPGSEDTPTLPGYAYVSKTFMRTTDKDKLRIEGVNSLLELEFVHRLNIPVFKQELPNEKVAHV